MQALQVANSISLEIFHAAFEQVPRHVATLITQLPLEDALEAAFVGTQNVDDSWVHAGGFNGVRVTPTQEVIDAKGCRSTSPGDFVRVVDAQGVESFYGCCGEGWRLLHRQSAAARLSATR
jgi:hypothetical protein